MGMIRIDTAICAACRICELGCSFHHLGAFAPRRSSIVIRKLAVRAEVLAEVLDEASGGRPGCDGCPDRQVPVCAEWCPTGAISVLRQPQEA